MDVSKLSFSHRHQPSGRSRGREGYRTWPVQCACRCFPAIASVASPTAVPMHRSSTSTSAAWRPRCLEPGSECEATACDRRSAPSCSERTQPSCGASTQSPSSGRTRTTSRGGSGSRDACGALLGLAAGWARASRYHIYVTSLRRARPDPCLPEGLQKDRRRVLSPNPFYFL